MLIGRVDVDKHGALFDGRGVQIMHHAEEQIEREVGRQGENDVHHALHGVLRHPTGRYEASVTVQREGDDSVIHGDKVIYGPWLEGTGSRNHTTRFPGYFTFRLVAQELEIKSGRIADDVLEREVKEL